MDFDKFFQYKNNTEEQYYEINIFTNQFKRQENYDIILATIVKLMSIILEKSNNEYNKDFVIINIDFLDFDIFSFDSDFCYTLITVMQNLYPEKLKTCNVYNMSSFYKNILRFILNLLDDNTRSKIKIIKKDKNQENYNFEIK